MADHNGAPDSIVHRLELYKSFDAARHDEMMRIALEYEEMRKTLMNLKIDIDDEQNARRQWRQRAEAAEASNSRNQFALVLIDGDGHMFSKKYLDNATDNGGAQAAHALRQEVRQQIHEATNGDVNASDLEVMVIVFLNKRGLAKALYDGGVLRNAAELDQFFWSFTQSAPLFQVVDIGYGKERADAKIRDNYKFYAYNVQCKHIFLACSHDSGYVTELEKYAHDQIVAPKTMLAKHENMSRQFNVLPFTQTKLPTVFEAQPSPQARLPENMPPPPPPTRVARTVSAEDHSSKANVASAASPPSMWSTVTAGATIIPTRTISTSTPSTQPSAPATASEADTKGVPVNRAGQRIDRRIQPPTQQDLDRFEARIAEWKMCNNEHLSINGCPSGSYCKFDHNPIDPTMKRTLRYKARSIPCIDGPKCRKAGCFYGHQCPWGGDRCTNPRCGFYKSGMHDIDDLAIAKIVPATS